MSQLTSQSASLIGATRPRRSRRPRATPDRRGGSRGLAGRRELPDRHDRLGERHDDRTEGRADERNEVWIAFIIVWQRFEDYVVQPLVYGRAVNVNPLVTIVSLLVGAELLGILGVLLAIPSAAAIQIILREW